MVAGKDLLYKMHLCSGFSPGEGWTWNSRSALFVSTMEKRSEMRGWNWPWRERRWWRAVAGFLRAPSYPQSDVILWYIFFFLCSHIDTIWTVDLWHSLSVGMCSHHKCSGYISFLSAMAIFLKKLFTSATWKCSKFYLYRTQIHINNIIRFKW